MSDNFGWWVTFLAQSSSSNPKNVFIYTLVFDTFVKVGHWQIITLVIVYKFILIFKDKENIAIMCIRINVSSVIRITIVYILWWSQYLNHNSDSLSQSIFAVVSYKQVMTCIHPFRTNAVLCLWDNKCRWHVFNKGLLFKYIHNYYAENTKNNRVPPKFNSQLTLSRACCPDHLGCMGD